MSEIDIWQPVETVPDADRMAVLLYYPLQDNGAVGHDFSIVIGFWDRTNDRYHSGWFQQGTGHDCFEEWNEESGHVPTHWMPLPPSPSVHGE